jgi:predicted house-cleaning noncanonical NTP pyrophosphatase (MazG superfamily)
MVETKLKYFLENVMSMTEVYQPLIIKTLLESGGVCSKTELAKILAQNDLSYIEYYKSILMKWPKRTLEKHNILKYDRKEMEFVLNKDYYKQENYKDELLICENKMKAWIFSRKNKVVIVDRESIRYKLLKNSKHKCQLCGIPSSLRHLEVDHIVPKSKANRYGKVKKGGILIDVDSEDNLQILCSKCNRGKRANDDTDFRNRNKLVRDKIPSLLKDAGKDPVIKILKNEKLLDALNEKLVEEHSEYIDGNRIEELADMIEVILAIAKQRGLNEDELMKIVAGKRESRGGFSRGYFYTNEKKKV